MAKKPSKDKAADTKSKDVPVAADAAAPPVPEETANADDGVQPIAVNAQYTKDLSFEAPGAPDIYALMQKESPDISVNVNVSVNPIQDATFEVVLEITAECKLQEKIAFILELEYAGVFTLAVPKEHYQPVLLIECPRLLFPYARNILSDVSRDGGFPPLMLGPLDFATMYQARLQEFEASQAAGGEAPEGNDDAGGAAKE